MPRRRRRVPSTAGYDSDASSASASSAITTTTTTTDASDTTSGTYGSNGSTWDGSEGSNGSDGSDASDSDASDASANSASTVVAALSSLHVDAASASAAGDALADNLATLGINATPPPCPPSPPAVIPNTTNTCDNPNNPSPRPGSPATPNALAADLASLTLDTSHADSDSDSGASVASNANTTIMSVSDAQETLDSFFHNHPFANTENNRLRLWLAMCIEFGLVDHPEATARGLPPLPTSTTQASKLLHEKAHVNLVDYRDARGERAMAGREPVWGEFRHLVFSSPVAMAKYTRGQIEANLAAREEARLLGMPVPKKLYSKVYPLDRAKEEMLNPLLRDIFRGPRR